MSGRRHSPRAFFLVGPTAVGKSAVAQWIAERNGFDILSADSMQVYRGLDIGTAKPSAGERARVRYEGLDLVDFSQRFSVGDYRAAALAAVGAAAAAGRPLIVTGGTGLYLKSLTHGLAEKPGRNEAIRAEAERLLAERGVGALQEWLGRLDPARLEALADPRNPRRLARAIELAAAGAPAPAPTWDRSGPRIPGLRMPLDALYARIEKRVQRMYADGLVGEVRNLAARGLASAPTAAQAIGYAEALKVLAGSWTREQAVAATVVRTRHLAKRQLTWFRRQANVDWLDIEPDRPAPEAAGRVLEYWEAHGPTPIAGV